MHKYHWADVCTLVRFACVGLLTAMAVGHGAVILALGAFLLGELMDALDGSLARRFPYPQDGKRRWWRDGFSGRLPEIYDQVADIMLALAALLYVGLNIHLGLALWLLGVGVCVAVPVQIWRAWRIHLIPDEDDDPLRQRVILARRVLYLLGMIVLVVAMIDAVPPEIWSASVKISIIAAGLLVAAVVAVLKRDRLQRDKPKK